MSVKAAGWQALAGSSIQQPAMLIFMPELISTTEVLLEQGDLLRRIVLPHLTSPEGYICPPKRSPGLHVSGLLRYVARKLKMREYVEDADEEDAIERGHLPLRWFVGQICEEGLASLYPEMVWQPGELKDPLIMTCDGLTCDPELGLIVEEFKARRYKRFTSGEAMLQKKWTWRNHGTCYCLGYGACYVRWHSLSLFEFPDPSYITYLVRFSNEDLRNMQAVIDANREGAIAEGFAE